MRQKLSLPRGWNRHVKSSVLQIPSLAADSLWLWFSLPPPSPSTPLHGRDSLGPGAWMGGRVGGPGRGGG